ncbi:MAG: hypothetical protein WBR26_23565 [Candidatus Acidiferrum sp.]
MAISDIFKSMITQLTPKRLCPLLLSACVLWIGGCYTRRVPAKPVVNFVAPVRPMLPRATPPSLESPPELEAAAPLVPEIVEDHPQPAKPHVAAPVVQEPAESEKHLQPTIAPEVTNEEMVAAKAETQQSLDVAEKQLTLAHGKNLDATQADLASKVRGFADNAREAMRAGDWERAKNLAKKAEVLAQQLAESL